MAHLREKVPVDFSDDERWYKYFTKKSLLTAAIGIGILVLMTSVFSKIGSALFGVIMGIFVGGGFFACTVIKYPGQDSLNDTGETIDVVIYRRITRMLKGRIFVNFHDNDDVAAGKEAK